MRNAREERMLRATARPLYAVRMTSRHVSAPVLSPGDKPKGPASYFPSIEKTYGTPIQEWLDLIVEQHRLGKRQPVLGEEVFYCRHRRAEHDG